MSRILLSLLAMFLLVGGGRGAAAQDFCRGIQAILNDAKNHFMNVRGSFDSMQEEYRGRVSLGNLRECFTETGKGVATYKCARNDMPDDESRAKQEWAANISAVEQCLKGDLKKRPSTRPNWVRWDYLPTGDDITIVYKRFVPKRSREAPTFYVELEVSYVDVAETDRQRRKQ